MAVHSNLAGLQRSAEQCNLAFKQFTDAREHIRAAPSVKHPVAPTHYSALYLQQPVVQEFDASEGGEEGDAKKKKKKGKEEAPEEVGGADQDERESENLVAESLSS